MKFPWLAVGFESVKQLGPTWALDPSGIPDLVVLDEKGNVVVDSYENDAYVGAGKALARFEELLANQGKPPSKPAPKAAGSGK